MTYETFSYETTSYETTIRLFPLRDEAYNRNEAEEVIMRRRVGNTLGMSLVELMIVVVIIGILAAISAVGYRKYIARARLSEATAMLAEFAAKEQLYFLENGQFAEAHYDGVTAVFPSANENATEFWPSNPSTYFDSARTPINIYDANGNLPVSWRRLGLRPRWRQLYCTYLVNAGGPGNPPPAGMGQALWGGATPNVPWFYALAACNLGGQAGWPNDSTNQYVTVLALTHDSPAIRTTDENQ
jgi:prepilin-type N-terminal cleavage/methylation domain-containing protein